MRMGRTIISNKSLSYAMIFNPHLMVECLYEFIPQPSQHPSFFIISINNRQIGNVNAVFLESVWLFCSRDHP